MSHAGPMPILANSLPKAGTFLLRSALRALPGVREAGPHLDIALPAEEIEATLAGLPAGGFATGHLVDEPPYREILDRVPLCHLLALRDPRDVAVSLSHYVAANPWHYLHPLLGRLSSKDRLMAVILGIREPAPEWDSVALDDLGSVVRSFASWRGAPGVVEVRFEELVGPAGGGSVDAQIAALRTLTTVLGLDLDEGELARTADRVFDPGSATFRNGRIGAWRQEFTEAHRRACQEVAGEVLVDLGYEVDDSWVK